jgi:thioredoxin reductase
MKEHYDFVIVGGGPAGLSAALIAGRALRTALLVDGGTPRNAAAPAIHSFLSRDGTLPRDFRAICHEELARYTTIQRRDGFIESVRSTGENAEVVFGTGESIAARKVVLAVGMVDVFPQIEGLQAAWGGGAHACPFCDGYEHRGEHWGVLVDQPAIADHAMFLRSWAGSMTAFVTIELLAEQLAKLTAAGVRLVFGPLRNVIRKDEHSLSGVEVENAGFHPIESLWLRPSQTQTSLVTGLGLNLRDDNAIWRDEQGQTSLPNILAAGDCAIGPAQQAIFAAADGARVIFPALHQLSMGVAHGEVGQRQ